MICGMTIKTINGIAYTSFEAGLNRLKNVVGRITYVFAFYLDEMVQKVMLDFRNSYVKEFVFF
jgi:hypothetical protein